MSVPKKPICSTAKSESESKVQASQKTTADELCDMIAISIGY